jgi:hypothetical protein
LKAVHHVVHDYVNLVSAGTLIYQSPRPPLNSHVQYSFIVQCRPRGSLQNRPMRVTSKPANEREAGQDLLYLAGGLAGNSFLRF